MVLLPALENEQEREFLQTVYQKHARLMYYTAFQILHDRVEAQDVVQESVVRLIDKIELLQKMDGCTLTAYVVSTIRNLSLHAQRKAQKQRFRNADLEQEELLNVPDGAPPMEEGMILREQRQALGRVWPKLDVNDRYLLEAKYILQKSDQEIGGDLGIQPASVRMRLTRARRKAFKLMEKEGATNEK